MTATVQDKYSDAEARNVEVGAWGSTLINSTTEYKGDYYSLTVVNDAIFSKLDDTTRDGDSIIGLTIPAGFQIFGSFTAIKLVSGTVLAYRGKSKV